jgi:hypothetical protein
VSLWTKDHRHDLMYKVTDVCDPKDCPTPLHVKVEPYKGKYLFKDGRFGSRPEGPVRTHGRGRMQNVACRRGRGGGGGGGAWWCCGL